MGVVVTSLLMSVMDALLHIAPPASTIDQTTTFGPGLRLVMKVVGSFESAKEVLPGPVHKPVSLPCGSCADTMKKLSHTSVWSGVRITASHGGSSFA